MHPGTHDAGPAENATSVLFMGTPDFAVPSLAALADAVGLNVIGVVTRPDKPAGRGRQIVYSPVKQLALERGIPVYQPGSLRKPESLESLRTLAPDLIVVAAFGQILPPEVLALPPHGCLNVHASLLPRWRGASPINAAILAGDAETGVTIMLMDAGLDTGPVLTQEATPIRPDETAGTLSDRLAQLGANLLVETIPAWLAGRIVPRPQTATLASTTRLLRKEDGRLDWGRSAEELARQVRAYTPWPGAFTTWQGRTLKVLRAAPVLGRPQVPPGRCFALAEAADFPLACACEQGALALEVVQLEGKRAMTSAELLRGHPALAEAQLGG